MSIAKWLLGAFGAFVVGFLAHTQSYDLSVATAFFFLWAKDAIE